MNELTIYNCPIDNFQEVSIENDYTKLCEGGTKELYEKLLGQLIDEFGLTEINQIVYHKTKQLVKLQAKRGYTEDASLDIKIALVEIELKNLLNKFTKHENIRQQYETTHRILTEWSHRDSHKLTVFQYYNDLRDFEKEINARKNRQRYHTHTGYDRSNPKGSR